MYSCTSTILIALPFLLAGTVIAAMRMNVVHTCRDIGSYAYRVKGAYIPRICAVRVARRIALWVQPSAKRARSLIELVSILAPT